MAEYIVAEKCQRNPNEKPWWWLSGETYRHRQLLKQQGARFSGRRKAWYFIGWELPTAIRQLVAPKQEAAPSAGDSDSALASVEEVHVLAGTIVECDAARPKGTQNERDRSVSGESLASLGDEPNKAPILADGTAIKSDEAAAPTISPAVRVIKPLGLPPDGDPLDAVQSAIRDAKTLPTTPEPQSMSIRGSRLLRINQSYCGELTGSISGQVFCYGYAIHDGVCVYVNMGGPRTSVEAIRAKLGKGDIVTLVPEDAPALELTAGEGNSGMYTDYLQTIPEARFTSLILLHDWVVNANYNGAATTFILRVSEAQAKAKLKHHVAQVVNLPVFDAWSEFLWIAGQAAALVRRTHSAGDIDLLTISLDAAAWTRLITGGVAQKVIQLPEIH